MIAKFLPFVIFEVFIVAMFVGCGGISSNPVPHSNSGSYTPPKVIGNIRSTDVTESSGIAASRCQSNVFWTHNDSGDEAFIYAFDRTGESLGTWKIPNAENKDWEDIATFKDKAGKCFLFIGETGNNKLKRDKYLVYRILEPLIMPSDASSDRKKPLSTASADLLTFIYPDSDHDAETLMVHPNSGDIYVITKLVSGPAGVYRIKSSFNSADFLRAELVATIAVPAVPNGFLTGGDISPDGRRVIICDYSQAYELALPDGEADFDNVWKQAAEPIDLGKRKGGESICYGVDGGSIFATSEGRNSPIIEVTRRY